MANWKLWIESLPYTDRFANYRLENGKIVLIFGTHKGLFSNIVIVVLLSTLSGTGYVRFDLAVLQLPHKALFTPAIVVYLRGTQPIVEFT